MSTFFIGRDTTLADSFESNYTDPQTNDAQTIRQMTIATDTEVEEDWVFPNLNVQVYVYHVEIGKLNWSDDRIGSADWFSTLRTGANGDADIELNTVFVRRVSADGNTIRASAQFLAGGAQPLPANTNLGNNATNVLTLDNPAGASITDHLVLVFLAINQSAHGGADTTSLEENTATSTRLQAPIDFPVTGFPHSQGHIF